MLFRSPKLLIAASLLLATPILAFSQGGQNSADSADGEYQYQLFCAECHEGALLEAPQRAAFDFYTPNRIVDALEFGSMATSGMALTRQQKRNIAYFLTGEQFDDSPAQAVSFSCESSLGSDARLTQPVAWNGWGGGVGNTRHRAGESILTKSNVGQLELKWAFAYPDATRARSQPVVTEEVTFIGSQEGTIFALDNTNGCPWWTFSADAEVRGAIFVDTDDQGAPETLLFGDFGGSAYAISAQTGELIWKREVHEHPQATITGSVIAHEDTLLVPVSSLEVLLAARVGYPCCSFRGAVVALSISSGEELWRTYTTDEPRPTILSTAGTQQFGPSGAPIWSSPTVDADRNLVYVGTGENYSSPANGYSDAVLAMDMANGEIVWAAQLTKDDAWNGACSRGTPNCPEEDGPDYDIGAAPILTRDGNGREIILVGQKSGMVYALDPAKGGELIWEQRVGSGGTMGGIHYGMSTNGEKLFVGVSDLPTNNPYNVGAAHPGVHALDVSTGEILWRNDLPNNCEEGPFLCWPGISAAVSSTSDLVFAGGLDGILRALDTDNGDILWETNTRQSFGLRNGIEAKGGSIESDGPVIVNGQVFITSGYEKWAESPGNVLLVYSLNGE
ncbi:PQQ-binding-like beta-propeller repeat protein [Gammaproteobacteria bacterium]|jgi:polyvinyl alcohol dehydrogenase (cytochrome)|nr:PQQ-binding-like beta-propeller repeat protein [Pseudomonadales bacterium]MDC0413347.1 PQQ-binding-like beta-propeller repeat protein [Gammaproteobacteria bacterium]